MLPFSPRNWAKVPNRISVEGHTDAKPFDGKTNYSNWELSADRANAARRLMQQAGLREDQVSQVRGFADQRLRNPKDPLDPSNRRISIIVQYITMDTEEEQKTGEEGKEEGTGTEGETKAKEEKPSPAGKPAEPSAESGAKAGEKK